MEMGQESPKSNLEDVKEEKTVETSEKIVDFDVNGKKINGEMMNLSIGDDKRDEEANESIGSPSLEPKSTGSPPNSNLEVNSTPIKGYGLKKWRIQRDLSNKDIDSLVILKSQLSPNEPKNTRDNSREKNVVEGEVETPTPSVGSLGSVESVDGVTFDPELAQLVASGGFSSGGSSTATSFPKPRHAIGFGRERTRTKNVGIGSGLDTGKQIRGDRIRLEKENSLSSIESDSRSSRMGFLRRGSGVSNGRRSEKSLNFDGGNGDEAQIGEDARSGYYKKNGLVEELLKEALDPDLLNGESERKRVNFHPPSGLDPFVESIVMMEAAQEALETEIRKFGEVGEAAALDDFDGQSIETEVGSSATPEPNLLELTLKIDRLQYKLEEASTIAKAKESKVIELEDIIDRTRLSKNGKVESELETILEIKIQAEIEFLIISRAAQSWKVVAEDRIDLLEEENMEDKAMKLKDKAEELESCCEELLGNERVLKLKKEVCKFSLCSFIQLLLLWVALGLFLTQLVTQSDEFVPT